MQCSLEGCRRTRSNRQANRQPDDPKPPSQAKFISTPPVPPSPPVTLEDIFEQLLGEEIMDEMDIRHASESAPSQKRALGRLVGMRVCSGHYGLPTALGQASAPW